MSKPVTCARCEEAKPRDAFYADPRKRSGVSSYCKQCARDYYSERRAANGDAMRKAVRDRYRAQKNRPTAVVAVCRDCNEEKPADGFYAQPLKRNGLSSYCKPCHRKRVRESKERSRAASQAD